MTTAIASYSNDYSEQLNKCCVLSACLFPNTRLHVYTLFAVAVQTVRVESLSLQPTCVNQVVVYKCHVDLPTVGIWWKHSAFGYVHYAAGEEEGSMKNTSDGRFVANLTINDKTGTRRMMASTLRVYPPLNDLNNTILGCEGFNFINGVIAGDATILVVGKWPGSMLVHLL